MKLHTYKSTWGMPGSLDDQFRSIAEAGFQGVECGLPVTSQFSLFKTALRKYKLRFIPTLYTTGDTWRAHVSSFKAQLKNALLFEPELINCHSSKDYFYLEDQARYFEMALEAGEKVRSRGVRIAHETHRTRALFSPLITAQLLNIFPELRITADFSHWCVVCESLLADQPAHMALAIARTDHIHGRVGHPEGAQVADPRAPEAAAFVQAHERWWKSIMAIWRKSGRKIATFTAEYGNSAAGYMPALPYTRQPVADSWQANLATTERVRAWFT